MNNMDSRISAIAKLAQVTEDVVEEWLYADWNNQEEHEQWLKTASDIEIAKWVEAGQ